MSMTDPIADMLTRIRNASIARHDKVDIPASNVKRSLAQILQDEGYIGGYRFVDDKKQGVIRIYLKYGEEKRRAISGLKRISKPGCRRYIGKKELPRVLGGFGTAILSTSKGIKTSIQCRQEGIGGEVICYIW